MSGYQPCYVYQRVLHIKKGDRRLNDLGDIMSSLRVPIKKGKL